jgi:tetratricopeptide (TPR) repeat protein
MFKKIILFIGIVFIFALVFIILQMSSGKITKKIVEPLDVALYYVQGPDDGSSCVSVGIFSKILRQEKIDDQIKGRDGKSKAKQSDYELYYEIDKSMWQDEVLFWALDENGRKNEIKKGIKLISSPDEGELCFTADSFYSAIYEIKNDCSLKQGNRIYAEVTIGKNVIISNTVTIPAKLSGECENIIKKAEVETFLGNYDKLMPIAEKIISIKGDSYLGYWYKGLALENEKDYKSALSLFETALKKYHQPSQDNILCEPPMLLAKKIKELKKITRR